MNIIDKIEEIKRQPEHVRLRYIWILVAIFMAVVIAIWIFSLSVNIRSNNAESVSKNVVDQFSDSKNQLKSITDNLSNSAKKVQDANNQGSLNQESIGSLNSGTAGGDSAGPAGESANDFPTQ